MTREMNLHERAETVRAMDRIMRSMNNESYIMSWFTVGVADGDINGTESDEDLEYYCEDETYSGLLGVFLILMAKAKGNGGLYSDGVLSRP